MEKAFQNFESFQNIEFFGMLCLGAFVGGVVNYGLTVVKNMDEFSKVSAIIFGSALSGVVFIFLQFLLQLAPKGTTIPLKSAFMYPVGLILSLLWLQINETIQTRIGSTDGRGKQIIGWLHFISTSAVTVLIVGRLLFGNKIQ